MSKCYFCLQKAGYLPTSLEQCLINYSYINGEWGVFTNSDPDIKEEIISVFKWCRDKYEYIYDYQKKYGLCVRMTKYQNATFHIFKVRDHMKILAGRFTGDHILDAELREFSKNILNEK